MGWVSARGDGARGIHLGFPCSITTLGRGDAGGEFDSGHHKWVVVASGLGEEGEDKKGDPVEEKDKPVEPRKGLERLVLLAVACSGGWHPFISNE